MTLIDKKEFKAQEKSLTKEKGKRWDGRSRISTNAYKENYDAIFKKKQLKGENDRQTYYKLLFQVGRQKAQEALRSELGNAV